MASFYLVFKAQVSKKDGIGSSTERTSLRFVSDSPFQGERSVELSVYDLDLLHGFAKTFPDSPMTDFIDDYCRWFRLAPPAPEDEPESEVTTEDKAKEKKQAKRDKYQPWRKRSKGPNARERRKGRRQAGKEGAIAEDLDQEEREELISSMTVSAICRRRGMYGLTSQKLLDKLKSSIFAHRVMAKIAIQEEDWANAVPFAEKARTLTKEVEKDRGIQLNE